MLLPSSNNYGVGEVNAGLC